MSKHSSLSNSPKVSEWLDFSQEGELILHTGKVDIGQRITTALALIAAEELSISFDQISVRKTKTDVDPNEGYTAGSFSMQHSGYAIKKATATARKIFTQKAAEKLNIAEDKLEVSDGQIRAKGTNQSLTYWELMSDVNLEIDVDEDVQTKNPSDYSIQNKKHIAKGMAEIMTGKYQFLQDLKFENMSYEVYVQRHADVVRSIYFQGVEGRNSTVGTDYTNRSFALVNKFKDFCTRIYIKISSNAHASNRSNVYYEVNNVQAIQYKHAAFIHARYLPPVASATGFVHVCGQSASTQLLRACRGGCAR